MGTALRVGPGKAGRILALAAVYFVAAKWGLTLAFVQANATAVWPPTGIALAALLLGGPELWPGVFLGAFLANLFTNGTAWTSVAIAAGNSLEAVSGSFLVRRWAGGSSSLDSFNNLFRFALLGGALATTVSATVGVGSLELAGYGGQSPAFEVWATWWLGDMAGSLLVAPPLLLAFRYRPGKAGPWQWAEGLASFLILSLLAWVLFGGQCAVSRDHYPLQIIFMPVLLWIAVRFSPLTTSLAVLVLSFVALEGTRRGFGPFYAVSQNQSLLFLQSFMAVTSLTLLAISCAAQERRKVEEDLRWSQSDLQLRVLERTEDLTRTNLRLEKEARERAALALELGASQEKFHLLSEATQEGVVLMEGGVIQGANSVFCRMFGYGPEEIIGRGPDEFVVPEARAAVRENIASHYERTYPVKGLRKDGETLDIEVTGRTVRLDGGTARVTAIRDVTERNRQEEAIRKLALLVETSSDFICLTSIDGHMTYVNGAGRDLTGLSREEDITTKVHEDFIAPEDIPRLRMVVLASLLEKGSWAGEFTLRHFKTGKPLPMHFTAELIRDPVTGEPRALAGIGRDLREMKKMEELTRSNQELEQFAYVASHDLQEPLRMIASFVQLLAHQYQGKLDAEADQYIGEIVDGARRMQALIKDLLTYSRLGKAMPFSRVDCGAALEEALRNLNASLRENKVEVRRGGMPVVRGDHNQVVQLFQNLIGNAVKFKGEKPPFVEIGCEKRGGEWLFHVRDNGIGLEPRYGEQIFEVFKRLHSRHEYPGTGIGLAICRKVVMRHGGRIWVESQLGQGACFFWTMPMDKGGEG